MRDASASKEIITQCHSYFKNESKNLTIVLLKQYHFILIKKIFMTLNSMKFLFFSFLI